MCRQFDAAEKAFAEGERVLPVSPGNRQRNPVNHVNPA